MNGQANDALPLRLSENIQGNILAPFNKPYQRFQFISFQNRADLARRWLAQLIDLGPIASTSAVFQHGVRRKLPEQQGDPEKRTWVGVSLTASGLVTLDERLAADIAAYDAFWRGALEDRTFAEWGRVNAPALVGDASASDPSQWVFGGPGAPPVDAVVTIAADEPGDLDPNDLIREAAAGLDFIELDCARLAGGKEHFGFKDGISQPGIRDFTDEAEAQADSPIVAAGEFVLGQPPEPRAIPRRPPPDWMHDGSFQVVLRLNQDVEGWNQQMNGLSASSQDGIDVKAKVIGRTQAGDPLDGVGAPNAFTYDEDPLGFVTPRCAHIRKMNPRNNDDGQDRIHRLLRRGIPFTDGNQPGLAFNAFMASIEDQFEFLLRNWASNPLSATEPIFADGPDPLIGASAAPCLIRRARRAPIPIQFGRYVWTTGAVYAFAPSIQKLRELGGVAEQ